ncbi:MAG: PHB depolymerase family esterase [Actinobacteria bacterium]|nr:PHB depolymerase family esterase [Actinomycetota bacterium]
MRRLVGPLLLALVALLAVPASAGGTATAGHREHGTFSAPGLVPRAYALYVPSDVAAKPHKKVPLLVYLHGCNQNADDVAVGTRLEQLAEEKGLLVLFPQQTRPQGSTYPAADGNGSGCWNWFLPDHQARGAGEPATLAAMTRDVMGRFAVDDRRVWLAGASAGADMTTILGATYPDLYAAIAPIAGCAYRTCSDGTGTAAHAAMGSRARAVPTLVVQGSADMVNNAAMGATAVRQWVATNDLADDGAANGSVPQQPSAVTSHDAVQGTAPGDPCVGNSRLPCLGGALGLKSYPYTVAEFGPTVTALVISGANHAYTGGDPRGTFVDPVGPDLAHAMYDFFAAHPFR